LLERRISKLGLQLEGTALEPLIRQLYDELTAKGLVFHPPCYVGDEWFVPIGIPAIFHSVFSYAIQTGHPQENRCSFYAS
jgi:hypothetical protein